MKKIILMVIISTAILFTACNSTPNTKYTTEFTEAPLNGKIYDYDNLPCANVEIIIDNSDIKVISDINGKFLIDSLTQGTHKIKFKKQDYQEDEIEFNFLNSTQVLYHKMISLEQIIRSIENAIDDKNWTQAESLIESGIKIDKSNSILNYLTAIYYYKIMKYEEAVKKLEQLIANGSKQTYVYLTLADINEYNLLNLKKSAEYLKKYLDLKDDKNISQRLSSLEETIKINDEKASESIEPEPVPEVLETVE